MSKYAKLRKNINQPLSEQRVRDAGELAAELAAKALPEPAPDSLPGARTTRTQLERGGLDPAQAEQVVERIMTKGTDWTLKSKKIGRAHV